MIKCLKKHHRIPDYFGDNLNALYDYVSDEMELPFHLQLTHNNSNQNKYFAMLWMLLAKAAKNVEGFLIRNRFSS